MDFVILDMKEAVEDTLILGKPFLKIRRAMIDVYLREFMLRLQDEQVLFNFFKSVKIKTCFQKEF